MQESTKKYTNHTKEKIEEYLKAVKECVSANNFRVCATSKNNKNIQFIEKYRLNSKKQKQMLLELETTDFCYSVDNYNDQNERLYIFDRIYELDNWGTIKSVEVYIKIAKKKDDFIVVVSFHEPEKNIKKLFI